MKNTPNSLIIEPVAWRARAGGWVDCGGAVLKIPGVDAEVAGMFGTAMRMVVIGLQLQGRAVAPVTVPARQQVAAAQVRVASEQMDREAKRLRSEIGDFLDGIRAA